mgnify:CR=1 FL=1
MKKTLAIAGIFALSIVPTPSFSGEVEVKEINTLSEQLLPQIGEKYNSLDKKEKKAYKKALNKYLKEIEKNEATGVSEAFENVRIDELVGFGSDFLRDEFRTFLK